MEQEIYKREFTASQIISESWKIYKANFSSVTFLALAAALVQVGLSLILTYGFGADEKNFIPNFLVAILAAVAELIAMMAIAYLVKTRIEGGRAGFGDSINAATARLWPLVTTDFIRVIFTIGLLFLLIIPGIIYGVYWTFAAYAVLFCGKSNMEALRYSKSMVEGRWGGVFWRSLGIGLVVGAVYLLFWLAAFLIFAVTNIEFSEDDMSSTGGSIITLANAFLNAFYYTATVVFFLNFDATKKAAQNQTVIAGAAPAAEAGNQPQ